MLAAAAARAQEPAGCELAPGTARTVTAIVDATTLRLDDGSEARLAGIIAPRAMDTATATAVWPPETEAVAELSRLVLGRTVTLSPVADHPDRYGRRAAHVFVESASGRTWIQGQMLERGHARAWGLGDSFHCADALLARERMARAAGLGLWAHAAYRERPAFRTRELMRFRSTFQIVTGRVRKVAETKGGIFLNFGHDWHTDFTAGLKPGRSTAWRPEHIAFVKSLEGRRVQVRGFIERRNGPYVEIGHPAELETLDADPPARERPAATTPQPAPR